MAQYDGSIRINTQINTKQANVNLSTLENRIVKTSDKIASLRSKMDALKDQKIPTTEYTKLQSQLDAAIKKYEELDDQVKTFQKIGMDTKSTPFRKAQDGAQELYMKIEDIRGAIFELEESGKAFIFGNDTDEFANLGQKLKYAENDMDVLSKKHDVLISKQKNSRNGYRELAKVAISSVNKIGNSIKKFAISSMKNLIKVSRIAFLKITKSGNSANKSVSGMGDTFKKMLRYGLGIRSLFVLFNKIRSAIVSGFGNLAQYSEETNAVISALKSSITQLKNSFATAFAPILTTVAPILTTFINMISRAVTYVGMLIAALTGQDTFTKAVGVQEDYAASLKNSAENAKKAEKSQKNYLSGLDEIRRYESNDNGNDSESSHKYNGPLPSQMFEVVPIENSMKGLAESVKEIFSNIFDPFQQAWATKGQQVISSAKNALSALGSLASSVGSSLMKVWSNGTGKTMLETMLQIGINLLSVIGNIALKLQEAWDKNSVGTGIIQNIANIYQRVLDFVNGIWQSTANWAMSLDFYPILESIKNLTGEIEPIVKKIGDLLLWVYQSIILPMAKYLLETALPFLINKISEFFEFLSSNQGVIEAIGAGLLAAFAAKKVISGITSIVGAVKNFMSLIKGAGGLLSLLTGSGGIVLAIGAVVAAGVLLYQNWDEICAAGKKIWDDFTKALSRTWDNIKTNASNMWKGITGFLGKTWEGLKSTASSVFSGIGDVAKGAWDGISKSVSSLCQIIQSNFPKAFNAAVSIIKKPINGIISLINGLINGVVTGINYVLSAFNHLRISVPSWVPGIGGKKLGFNFGMLTAPQIPYLATGAVIPPNAPFMAVLGDQKHGTNIEAPLSVIEDAVERALSKHQNTGGNGNYTFIGQINRRVLFEEVISEAVIKQTVSGKNPFLLGG